MIKRIIGLIMCFLMAVSVAIIGTSQAEAAAAKGPIKNNGTNGIYIDILGWPYTSYANIANWGQYAYTESGCAWFASARTRELTGKGTNIYSGYSWWSSTGASLGFSKGSTPKAKALACFENHVSVIERVDGNILTISEGGVRGSENAQYGYCHITTKTIAEFEAGNVGTGAFYGYVYLGVSVDNEPLTSPVISTDKNGYSQGDTVQVSWVASSANSPISHYWINIITPSGATLTSERINNATSYSFTATEEGQYRITVYATPVGSQSGEGSLTEEAYITVAKKAGTPVLSVKGGTSTSSTVFTWASTENATSYMLDVTKTDGTVSSIFTLKNTDTAMEVVLSKGTYKAVLTAYSSSGAASPSEEVEFTVNSAVDSADGWIYTDTLPSNITSDKYEIQRQYTYAKHSSVDLGDEWTKGEFVETVYENSGEPYWSQIELETSDTRELVNYIYYHYCGGSTGNNANYTYLSSYPHYDWLPKDNVIEQGVYNDYDDARYKYYHLVWKTGGDAYCNSNVSCDASYGTHGNRSYYWYKSCQYQDRTAVDYYRYSLAGDWTTAIELNATETTYRYRLKEGGYLLGDANLDGVVNIKDVTAIQKYLVSIVSFTDNAKLCADATRDGVINIKDATQIQKYIALLLGDTKIGTYI